ncbi:MAG: putative toxin-antitoxin system toxin component, PIN family [Fibromonadaceae bacterium]|nr:putative toxin-antitoxin system toxin component, PIN family [Fibromonadaceae bacterium]
MKLIIDTNLWISYLISERLDGLEDLCLDRNLSVIYCDELIEEIIRVAAKPKIRKRGVEDHNVSDLVELIKLNGIKTEIKNISGYAVRDLNDAYLLALIDVVKADFLLTGDDDLLVLKRHAQTEIISYSNFMVKYKSFLWRLKRFFKNLLF